MDSHFHHYKLQKDAEGGGGGGWLQARQSQTLLEGAQQKDKRQWTQVTTGEILFCKEKKVLMRALSTGIGAHRGYWEFSKFSWTTQSDFEFSLALSGQLN